VSYPDVFVILASKVLADRRVPRAWVPGSEAGGVGAKGAPRFGYQPHSTSTQAIQPPGPMGNRFRTSSVRAIFISWRFGARIHAPAILLTRTNQVLMLRCVTNRHAGRRTESLVCPLLDLCGIT
jgi:hypothetical protein